MSLTRTVPAHRVAGPASGSLPINRIATSRRAVMAASVVGGLALSTVAYRLVLDGHPATQDVGYGEIDGQHQVVLDLLASLEDAISNGVRAQRGKALTDLATYVTVHFDFEESLMNRYRLPNSGGHKDRHRDLLHQVGALATEFAAGRADVTPDVIAYLRTWLTEHITTSDSELGRQLKDRGIRSAI